MVIKEFLSKPKYDELFETRIQKLIFYSEVYSITHYRMRLTEATYKPYMYGAYSEDVRDVLESMRGITRKRTIRYGDRTVGYRLSGDQANFESDQVVQRIVDRVHEATEFKETSDLAQFSKESFLFENTEYNHQMRFEEFAEALDAYPDIEKELMDELPDKVVFKDLEPEDGLKPITN